jgi:hypothetical protein
MQITTINIKQLIFQGVKVVLVCSDTAEKRYYENFDIHVVMAPNNPLGQKWQAGVDYARQFDPSHIVITGSDDLLSIGFFEKYCHEQVIGFWAWYIWSIDKLFHLQYFPNQPLGGGRVYPKKILDSLNWRLFDTTKNKCLDDYAYKMLGGEYVKNVRPEILAIKGNWPMMNPVDLKHKNVKLLATFEGNEALKIMKEKFSYEPNN